MISKEDINNYISKIPPAPDTLKEVLKLLNEGELVKASHIAKEDLALSSYLKNIVNKPIYGFTQEVNDVSQIFGILGVSSSQQCVYNYMLSLLSPKKWHFFHLNEQKFSYLQIELSANWKRILSHLDIKNKNIESSITLLPASIIVSEALFKNKIEEVNLIKSTNDINLNQILKRLSNMDLFDISQQISKKWDMPKEIGVIIKASSGLSNEKSEKLNLLGKWMHLLLFYTLSKSEYIEAGLNDFIEFQIDYVSDIYEDFAELMEVS
jgi:HD-like signal output (HDOD) protein